MARDTLSHWIREARGAEIPSPFPKCDLICGDARQLLSSLPPESIGCVITSPPYGDQKDYGTPGEMGAGTDEEFRHELRSIFSDLFRACKPGAAFWLVLDSIKRNGSDIPLPWEASSLALEVGWRLQDAIVWDKGRSLPWSHAGHFRSVCEHVLLLSKGPLSNFAIDAARESEQLSPYWVKYPERYNPAGKAPADIWHFPTPIQGSWSKAPVRHLCPFPVAMIGRMLALTTEPGDVVLDPFAGSGSVVVTAKHMGRQGLGIELSPQYFRSFCESGASRLLAEAAKELPSPRTGGVESLAETIIQLRSIKSAKTLFSELARHDRMGKSAIDGIASLIVKVSKQANGVRSRVEITANLRTGADRAAIETAAKRLLEKAPLSKFGILITFKAQFTTDISVRRILRGRSRWFEYLAGRFNYYKFERNSSEARVAVLAALKPARASVPPIFSNIGLRVKTPV